MGSDPLGAFAIMNPAGTRARVHSDTLAKYLSETLSENNNINKRYALRVFEYSVSQLYDV